MSLEIAYYDGSWIDITGVARTIRVEDFGISKVPSLSLNVHSDYSTLANLRANGLYKQIRVLLGGTRVFLGRTWEIPSTAEPATTAKQSLTLDCRSLAQRLADDTVTVDYYKLASATYPDLVWSYKTMMNDFLTTPDTGYDTGFEIDAPTGGNIDATIDSSCVFEKQSLLDAIRTVCDKIGYDGWFEYNDATTTPTVYLRSFGSTASVATFTHPFKGEPSWSTGSLDDVFNYIYVHGGNDSGVPADGDRWTERAYNKYNPRAWTTTTGTISDADNTVLGNFGINDYCIKSASTSKIADATLEIAKTNDCIEIDCKDRVTKISFILYLTQTSHYQLQISLIDDIATTITHRWKNTITSLGAAIVEGGKALSVTIPVGKENKVYGFFAQAGYDNWYKLNESDPDFHWDKVRKIKFYVRTANPDVTETMYIDGLQFVGGHPIDPFTDWGFIYDPAVKDDASIATYGIHILHLQDTALDSFEIAQKEGQRVLANLKNPVPTFTFTVPFTTVIRPSNIITVTCAQFGLNSTDMRVLKVQYDWNSKNKRIFQTITCTSKLNPLPPLWTSLQELRPLVK